MSPEQAEVLREAYVGEGKCEWFWYIGGLGCDNCGKSARSHKGWMKIADGPFTFPAKWEKVPW